MESNLRKTYSLLPLALTAAFTLPALAQQAPATTTTMATAPGKGVITETTKVTATVTAIDKANRTVTLKGPKGKSETITAGPEVRNFDQIKVGDKVVAEYVQALSLELKKAGGATPAVSERSGAARAPAGDKPGAAGAQQITVLADVIDLDPARQVVVLKGPKGKVVDLKVRDPEQFKLVKMGDQVEATYTEALAVAVVPAKK